MDTMTPPPDNDDYFMLAQTLVGRTWTSKYLDDTAKFCKKDLSGTYFFIFLPTWSKLKNNLFIFKALWQP